MSQVDPIPEGLHTITPYVLVSNAAEFIRFCQNAFEAFEQRRALGPDGKSIWHAHLRIGSSALFISDESMGMGRKSAKTLGDSPLTIQLNVGDADATYKRAIAAGATARMPPQDMFWGDRYGQITDPFGNIWGISQHIKNLTPDEMAKAGAEAAKQFKQG